MADCALIFAVRQKPICWVLMNSHRVSALSISTSMNRWGGRVCPSAINIRAKYIAKPFMAKLLAGSKSPSNNAGSMFKACGDTFDISSYL